MTRLSTGRTDFRISPTVSPAESRYYHAQNHTGSILPCLVSSTCPHWAAGHLCVLRARASTISGTAAFSMLSISQYGRIHGWLEQQTTDRVHDAQLTTRVPLEGEKAKTILVPHGGMVSLVSMHIFHGVVALAQE